MNERKNKKKENDLSITEPFLDALAVDKHQKIQDKVNDLIPSELTRREVLVLATGFDSRANIKILGAFSRLAKR